MKGINIEKGTRFGHLVTCGWSKILGIPRETLKRHLVKGKIKGEIFRRGTGVIYPYKEFGWS